MRRLAWLLCLGACDPPPAVPPEGLAAVFEDLHAPVYRVYGLGPDRDAVHGALAESFTGEALTDEYVEHWRTLVRMAEEHTAITVSAVEYDAVEVLDGEEGRWRVDATWLVRGVVQHQAHRHPRINRYRAIYTLIHTPDGWRIADTHMRDLARIATQVSGDDIFDDEAGSGAEDGFMDPLEMFEGGLFDEGEP